MLHPIRHEITYDVNLVANSKASNFECSPGGRQKTPDASLTYRTTAGEDREDDHPTSELPDVGNKKL